MGTFSLRPRTTIVARPKRSKLENLKKKVAFKVR
jgi:hypothetical protein